MPPKKPRPKLNNTPEPYEIPRDQVVFRGHISQDTKKKPYKPIHPREVQHVVIPYSPFMYQRFYDWPPEQAYAQVRADSSAGTSSTIDKFAQGQVGAFDSIHPRPTSIGSNSFFTSSVATADDKKNQ